MRKPHLALRKAGESARPPGGGARPEKADRDPSEFCRMQAGLLDAMRESYERDRDAAPPYMDPSLIFKIELLSGVHDDTFRADLKRVGINTIASAPDRDGYWVAFADDPNLTKFRQRLEKYESDERASFVDQIKAVREIPPPTRKREGRCRPGRCHGTGGSTWMWRRGEWRTRAWRNSPRACAP